ncbi:putative IQ motif, EF-hand binding, FYVE zinc finger, myosin head, motor domain-containing protein [Plasmopara halstedii]
MDVGTHVWIKSNDPFVWKAGEVIDSQDASGLVPVRLLDTGITVYRHHSSLNDELCLRNMSTNFTMTSSLTSLEHLHEPAVLQALHERFDYDQIYTSIGDILVALNPFKPLPKLYSDIQLNVYKQNTKDPSNMEKKSLPPHVFSIGSKAFGGLLKPERRNQSILVSGESGSGKTESTKFLMQFLTSVGRDSGCTEHDESDAVEIGRRILQTNPILESFGNAQTIRNDNSSRFGKFIKIQFGQNNEIVGAQIMSYLLEKVRVLHQNPEERSFHIFYELLEGADKTLLDKLGLTKGGTYELLNSYGPNFARKRAVVDKYAHLYTETIRAFKDTGVGELEQLDIFKILAALLHLGNVNFIAQGKQDAAVVTAASRFHLEKCAELMGVDVDKLATLLSSREIKAGMEIMVLQHTSEQAKETCRSLAKAIYGRLFTWLVRRLSDEINYFDSAISISEEDDELATIGILDIFGFESLNRNGFEQLCINYANERLQAQFNEFVFVREQQVYMTEGIDWTTISYSSNEACLALFDDKSKGLFSLLDQECLMPKGSNQALCTKFYRYLGERGSADSAGLLRQSQVRQSSLRRLKSSLRRHIHRAEEHDESIDQGTNAHPFSASKLERVNHQFAIFHFAGRVCYNVEQFVEKNTDSLPTDASDILSSASNAVVSAIGTDETENPDTDSGVAGRRRYSMLRTPSVSAEFKCQLDRLIAQIGRTEAHYVRCLKPNEVKKPGIFDRERMVEQMRSVGLLEAVRIARHGYSVRLAHGSFVEQFSEFKSFISSRDRASAMSTSDLAQALVTVLMNKVLSEDGVERKTESFHDLTREADGTPLQNKSHCKDVQVGKTLVFCKSRTFDIFCQYRLELRVHCAIVLQKHYRGYRRRAVYRELRCFLIHIQAIARGFIARAQAAKLRQIKCERAAACIHACWRRFIIRRNFLQLLEHKRRLDAVLVIQTRFRQFVAKRKLAKMLQIRKENAAALVIQTNYRHWLVELKLARLRRNQLETTAALHIQPLCRQLLARRQQDTMQHEPDTAYRIQENSCRWLEQDSNTIAKLERFRLRIAFRKFRRACEVAKFAGEMEAEPSPSDNSLASCRTDKFVDHPVTLSSLEQEDSYSTRSDRMEPPLQISAPFHRRTSSKQRNRVNNRNRTREGSSHTDQRNLLLENEILRLQQMLVEQQSGPSNGHMHRSFASSRPPRRVPLDFSQSTCETRTNSSGWYSVDSAPSEGEEGENDADVSLLPPRRARSVLPTQDVDHVSRLSQKIEELDAKCKFLEQLVARNTYDDAARESIQYTRGSLDGRECFALDGSPSYDNRPTSETGSDVDSIISNMQNQIDMLRHSIAASDQTHQMSRKTHAMSLSSSTRPTRSSSIVSLTSYSNLSTTEAPRKLPSLPLSESQLSIGGSSHGNGTRTSLGYPSPPTSSNASSLYQSQQYAPAHFGRSRPRIVKWARSSNCYECEEPFNLFMRRHHCRMCGNSFCHEHSSRRVSVFGIGFDDEPVRVCDNCFAEYYVALQEQSTPQYPSQLGLSTGPLYTSSRLSGL